MDGNAELVLSMITLSAKKWDVLTGLTLPLILTRAFIVKKAPNTYKCSASSTSYAG